MSELNVTVRYNGAEMKSGTSAALGELKRMESAASPASQSLQKVAGAAAFSGEKMARFGTVTAALTGTMGALPVHGEAVAKVFGVMGDLAAGAVNPLYLVVGAVGAVAAALAILKRRRDEENQAIRESNDLLASNLDLLQRRAGMNPGDQVADYLSRGSTADLEAQIAKLEERRQGILNKLIIGGTTRYKTNPNPAEYFEGQEVVPDYVAAYSPDKIAKMKKEANEATAEIDKLQAALNRLRWTDDLRQGADAPDGLLDRRRAEAEQTARENERARIAGMQRASWLGGSWSEVPADYRLRLQFRSSSQDRQLGRIPDWLRGNIEQAGEEDARRMDAERERIAKTTAIYNEQIQTIRGTLDSMFSAAWENAGRGFDKMVAEMAKVALQKLGWFFLGQALDRAAPGIGTAFGLSPRGSGNKSMGSGFGADATAAANLARRAARG